MDAFNHYLTYLIPFGYWAIISTIYHFSKIGVMTERVKEKTDLFNKCMMCAGGTLIVLGISFLSAVLQEMNDQKIDVFTFILLILPMIWGMRNGYKLSQDEIDQWNRKLWDR